MNLSHLRTTTTEQPEHHVAVGQRAQRPSPVYRWHPSHSNPTTKPIDPGTSKEVHSTSKQSFRHLSFDAVVTCFTFLPIDQRDVLVSVRSVCRNWYAILSSMPTFRPVQLPASCRCTNSREPKPTAYQWCCFRGCCFQFHQHRKWETNLTIRKTRINDDAVRQIALCRLAPKVRNLVFMCCDNFTGSTLGLLAQPKIIPFSTGGGGGGEASATLHSNNDKKNKNQVDDYLPSSSTAAAGGSHVVYFGPSLLEELTLDRCQRLSDAGLKANPSSRSLAVLVARLRRLKICGTSKALTKEGLALLFDSSPSLSPDNGSAAVVATQATASTDGSQSPFAGTSAEQAPKLRSLVLSSCEGLYDDLDFLLPVGKKLRQLDLTLTPISPVALRTLAFFTSLRHLNLYGCETIDDSAFYFVAQIPSLVSLNLCGCSNITDAGVKLLATPPLYVGDGFPYPYTDEHNPTGEYPATSPCIHSPVEAAAAAASAAVGLVRRGSSVSSLNGLLGAGGFSPACTPTRPHNGLTPVTPTTATAGSAAARHGTSSTSSNPKPPTSPLGYVAGTTAGGKLTKTVAAQLASLDVSFCHLLTTESLFVFVHSFPRLRSLDVSFCTGLELPGAERPDVSDTSSEDGSYVDDSFHSVGAEGADLDDNDPLDAANLAELYGIYQQQQQQQQVTETATYPNNWYVGNRPDAPVVGCSERQTTQRLLLALKERLGSGLKALC